MLCPVHKARNALPECTAGERDNDDFLLHYGFVPPGNPHDSVLLFPSLGAALEWYFDRAAPQVCPSCILLSLRGWDVGGCPDVKRPDAHANFTQPLIRDMQGLIGWTILICE